MTHKSSHIIIHGITDTVSYGNSTAVPVWAVVVALVAIGAVLGAWIG